MSGRIHILPPSLASQIAAGEVVDRPSSCIKELVENALDADATRCEVEITGGGITRMLVRDNGCGMPPDDARLALERHATSKLSTVKDLDHVASFGFRGEALPSIASVSRFRLATRTQDSDEGVEISAAGTEKISVRPAGLAVGTEVEVRDLFFNVPARRKFLRSSGTESGHITEALEGAALARPDISFTLTRDGRVVRRWLRVEDRAERVAAIVPDEELAPCKGERGPLKVEAYLARPERARQGAGGLRLMVNGRAVRDRGLLTTVAQAYGSVLERGRYPRGAVYLDLPSRWLDVNVHPRKMEVRFSDPRTVTDAVYRILSAALSTAFGIPTQSRSSWSKRPPADPAPGSGLTYRAASTTASLGTNQNGQAANPSGHAQAHTDLRTQASELFLAMSPGREPPVPAPTENANCQNTLPNERWGQTKQPGEPRDANGGAPRTSADVAHPDEPGESHPSTPFQWSSLSFVAQAKGLFLICEASDGIYILDQHAAAERVNFHKLRKQYRSRSMSSQALLFAVTIDTSAEEAELTDTEQEELHALGFDLRRRGPDSISIHGVPRLLQHASPERMVRDLFRELTRGEGRAFSDAVDLSLANMACHASIRAGDPVSAVEARALLDAMDEADFAGYCPHGRPVVMRIGWTDLERQVGRK